MTDKLPLYELLEIVHNDDARPLDEAADVFAPIRQEVTAKLIKELRAKQAPATIEMFLRWITGGLISNQGSFIVTTVSKPKLRLGKSLGDFTFKCECEAEVVPSGKRMGFTYDFKSRKGHYKGERNNLREL